MKGQKTGGRTKGTPNKNSVKNRDWINDVLNKNRKKLERELKTLNGRDFCFLYEKFFSYVTPKIQVENVSFEKLTESQIDDLIQRLTANIDDTEDDTEDTDQNPDDDGDETDNGDESEY